MSNTTSKKIWSVDTKDLAKVASGCSFVIDYEAWLEFSGQRRKGELNPKHKVVIGRELDQWDGVLGIIKKDIPTTPTPRTAQQDYIEKMNALYAQEPPKSPVSNAEVMKEIYTSLEALPTSLSSGGKQRTNGSMLPLNGKRFMGQNLDNAAFIGSALIQSLWLEVKATKIDLQWARLDGSRIENSVFTAAFFKGANLNKSTAIRSSFQGCVFKNAKLIDSSFRGCDLRGCSFVGADLARADFSGCDLEGSDFTGADLTGTILTGANLAGTILKGSKRSLKATIAQWLLS